MEDPIIDEVANTASDAFMHAQPGERWQTVARAVLEKLHDACWLSPTEVDQAKERAVEAAIAAERERVAAREQAEKERG